MNQSINQCHRMKFGARDTERLVEDIHGCVLDHMTDATHMFSSSSFSCERLRKNERYHVEYHSNPVPDTFRHLFRRHT